VPLIKPIAFAIALTLVVIVGVCEAMLTIAFEPVVSWLWKQGAMSRKTARIGRAIELVHAPSAYRPWQLDNAVRIAAVLHRGTFWYLEPPRPRG
jgi:hypothetical protein